MSFPAEAGIAVDLLFVSLGTYERVPPPGQLDLLSEEHLRQLDEPGGWVGRKVPGLPWV